MQMGAPPQHPSAPKRREPIAERRLLPSGPPVALPFTLVSSLNPGLSHPTTHPEVREGPTDPTPMGAEGAGVSDLPHPLTPAPRPQRHGEWAFLGSLLDAVQLQSPLVGRLWLVVMLIFRILVLATVGGAVFEDEQEEFVCNTLQPGCRQTCYDRAFPVSHYRFWLFHILLLSAPPVLFVVYSMHRAGKEAGGAQAAAQCAPGLPEAQCAPCALRARRARRCYLLSVALRLLAELTFLGGQALLYGFRVVPHFACAGPPCPHTVDCFVSRPTEKTVFVLFYFAVGLLSALLSLAELGHLLWKGRPAPGSVTTAATVHTKRRRSCSRRRRHLRCRPCLPGTPAPSPAPRPPMRTGRQPTTARAAAAAARRHRPPAAETWPSRGGPRLARAGRRGPDPATSAVRTAETGSCFHQSCGGTCPGRRRAVGTARGRHRTCLVLPPSGCRQHLGQAELGAENELRRVLDATTQVERKETRALRESGPEGESRAEGGGWLFYWGQKQL
uniref:Gap junction protein n=1 Tax=Macaca fascicularis TaxID=9541 RepID=A0A2K5UF43_MACFA